MVCKINAVSNNVPVSRPNDVILIQVRVVDMYLVEGPKILYRLAISALKLFASLSQKLGMYSRKLHLVHDLPLL